MRLSGFLNKVCHFVLRRKKLTLLLALVIIALVLRFEVVAPIVLVAVLCAVANVVVVRKTREQSQPFSHKSTIRNVDYLVIGDLCNPCELVPEGSNYVAVCSPGRSLASSYEILRHTYSILNEDTPNVIIIVRRKHLQDGYTAFDLSIFSMSPISVKRLGVEALCKKEKLLLLYYPTRTIQLLLGCKRQYTIALQEIPQEIQDYCQERLINLQILTR